MFNFKAKIAKFTAVVLALGSFAVLPIPAAHAAACTTSGITANNLEIKPVMDTKFYIDSARFSPMIDAAYAGFTVKNTSGASKQGLWVSYTSFFGGSVSLSDSKDQYIPLETIGASATVPTYVLFKASSITTTDQKFTFTVYSGKPDVVSSIALVNCEFTYTDVVDSINANANKLQDTGWNPSGSTNAAAVQISKSNPTVGETVTVWVQGNTGNVGSGATLNLTPATTSQWPTRVLRLQHVSINIARAAYSAGSISSFSENLAIANADTLTSNSGGDYRATYVFQVIGTNSGNVAVRPMQHISSGTQYKHTDASSATINVTMNASLNASMSKTSSASSTRDADTNYWLVPYTLTLSTNSAANVTVDEIIDSPDATVLFSSGSARITDVNNSSATTIPDPGAVNADGKLHFSGPFVMNSGRTIVITYNMKVPVLTSGTSRDYTNTATAKIGDITISSGSNAIITTVSAGGTNYSAPVQNPDLLTVAATNVDSTTATINGTININDVLNALNPVFFKYSSTDPTLATSSSGNATPSTISATGSTNVLLNLIGLTPATKYYFQVFGTKSSTTYQASNILNFTTIGITTVSADLNQGTVGSAYTDYIFATGGSGSYTNWVITGGSLPTGTTLEASTGKVSGNPTVAGTFTFTVKVTDSAGATHEKQLEIIINPISSFIVTFNPDGGTLASGNATDTATVSSGGNGLASKPGTNPSRSGYTFAGWALTSGGSVITSHTVTSTQTYYAIWTANAPAPAPVYVPHPPTITGISAPEVCALNSNLTITGTYLSGATVTVDGVAARVLSSSYNELIVALPDAVPGTKVIKVTNVDGSATTSVKYKFVDTPEYVNYTYPEMFKDIAFTYTFSATGAEKYSVIGKLPAGLTLNPLTGELSGTPTVDGEFQFTIVANNICDNAYLDVYMLIDKAIPDAFTCSVAFNVPSSNNISEVKLAALKNCFDKIIKLGPTTLDPVLFLSGGVPPGLTTEELLNHPRYLAICQLLNEMGIIAQIVVGAFDGPLDQVQIMAYWPVPFDV